MKKQMTQLGEIKLVGLTARTNNRDEIVPEKSKIAALAGAYWGGQEGNNIQHRVTPGVTYAVYTDYESDENGEYTYFIGEAVDSFDGQDTERFETLTIPASHYQTFTTPTGPMPDIVIAAWQEIWQMQQPEGFGGKRRYIADFEVYDARAADPSAASIDVYIGVDAG